MDKFEASEYPNAIILSALIESYERETKTERKFVNKNYVHIKFENASLKYIPTVGIQYIKIS